MKTLVSSVLATLANAIAQPALVAKTFSKDIALGIETIAFRL